MKNIHVLPTDKPSELYINMQGDLSKSNSLLLRLKSRNIYITSSEEIKEGDWVVFISTNEITKVPLGGFKGKVCQKIILTTDQDLIKYGVQAIDDEFLEWFVKNPSCEFVEVEWVKTPDGIFYHKDNVPYGYYKIIIPKEEPKKIFNLPIATNLGSALTETMKSVSQHKGGKKHGEINLPNFKEEVCTCTDECLGYLTKSCKRIEEPKQETLTNDTDSHSWGFENFEVIKTEEDVKIFVETMENIPEPNNKLKKAFRDFNKQETLEEAAEIFVESKQFRTEQKDKSRRYCFIQGAKWQQEQGKNKYSEKEVKHLMTLAFEQGFKKADVVEAGLEAKETDTEVNWIFLKHKK